MKDTQTRMNEDIEEQARERVAAIERAMADLGLHTNSQESYDVLNELYSTAWHAGSGWEYNWPS